MRVAWEDPGIGLALGGVMAVGALISPFIGLVPVFALQVLHLDVTATSLLVTAQGAGAVIAAFSTGAIALRLGRRRLLEGTVLLLGPVAALYWMSPNLPFAAVALFCLGALYLMVFTGLKTVVQARAPHDLQARVSSLFMMLMNLGYSAGVAAQALLADRVGVRPITAGAALLFLTLVLATRALRPRGLEALGT
jgi:predicted MFS family arabinose efflux permease